MATKIYTAAAASLLAPSKLTWEQELSLEADREKRCKRLTIRNAIDISLVDESFRRDLLEKLKVLGEHKKGKAPVKVWEAMGVITAFDLIRSALRKPNKPLSKVSDLSVAERLIELGHYTGKAAALGKRYRRYRTKISGHK